MDGPKRLISTFIEKPAASVVTGIESRDTIMQLPSFRVRTLMLAVGLTALLLWVAMMGMRSYDSYRLATEYATQESRLAGNRGQAFAIEG